MNTCLPGTKAWTDLRSHLTHTVRERGAGRVVDAVLNKLESRQRLVGEERACATLGQEDWESCLKELAGGKSRVPRSYNSRLRYRRILQRVSQELARQGLSAGAPNLELSPQHARESIATIPILGAHRLSDFQRLMEHLRQQLAGCTGALIPASLSSQTECWLAVLLIATGAAGAFPLSRLGALRWKDVDLGMDAPIRWPRGQGRGYLWLWVSPVCRLMLSAAARRSRMPSAAGHVFPFARRRLARMVNQFLQRECQAAGVPPMTIEALSQLARFELSQGLPNVYCAAVQGQIDFPPVPQDQVAGVLSESGLEAASIPELGTMGSGVQGHDERPEELMEGEDDLRTYDEALREVRPLLQEAWRDDQVETHALQTWMQESPVTNERVKRNIGWLLRWQMELLHGGRIKRSSCRSYWTAALRVLRDVPSAEIGSIGEADLQDVLRDVPDVEGGASRAASRKLSRAAWKSLHGFLEENGEIVPSVDWRNLRIARDRRPVRVISRTEVRKLMRELKGTPLEAMVWLSFRTGLRVSEVCRLRAGDLDLTGHPCLAVDKSKRGRRRLVDLAGLTDAERAWLKQSQERRRQAAPEDFFFTDAEGQPLDPKAVSRQVSEAMRRIGIRKTGLDGQEVSFHDLRAAAADGFLGQDGDIRRAALQLGHANVTTTEGYTRCLDLRAVPFLRGRTDGWHDPNLHIPLSTLAVLLGVTDRRAVQMVKEVESKEGRSGVLKTPDQTPDGMRPARRGKPAYYISVRDAQQLLERRSRSETAGV